MRKAIMLGITAAAALAGSTGLALAQTATPPAPPPPMEHPGMDHPGMERPGMERPWGMMHGPQGGMMAHRMGGMMHRMREFALVYPAKDRALSGPDVQKIAEAFLLLNGNHTWKITEVTEEPNRVTFAVATPDGTAIAHFAMDRHTARPQRIS
jgi:hypothetical protein